MIKMILVICLMNYEIYNKSDKWPNMVRWWADISTQPSWQFVKNGIPEEYNGE